MVVRAVHIHEPFANRRENIQGRWRTVHKLAVCSTDSERAFEDELIFVAGFEAVLFQKIFQRRFEFLHIENSLDRTSVAAAADERAVGAFAEDEVERADDDGLARAGFAGDGVATGLEFQREVVHEGEVFNAQGRQHGQISSHR